MESGDSCSGLSVRIARSQAAALANNAACYSSVANIGRYQLGSGPAERTSETLTGGEAISTIASTLRRITARAVAIDRSTHLIQCGVARRERLGHRRRLVLRAAAGHAAVLERQTVGIFEIDRLGPLVIDDIGDVYSIGA
jgi:hypothetical protein